MSDFGKKIEDAAAALAEAVTKEATLEDNRAVVKLAAIERIMRAGDNTMTGKPHSFSSAEAAVNTDPEYQEYLQNQRLAVRDRILARGQYDAAVAVARIAGHDA